MEHQLAGAKLVVGQQCPGVQAQLCLGQRQVVARKAGQLLQAAAEVIAQVADQAADEGQFDAGGQLCFTQLCQAGTQAFEEGAAILVGLSLQVLHGPGAEQVEAAAFGTGAGAVEQDRAGGLAQAGEIGSGVGLIGQGVKRTGRHQCGRRCKSEEGDCRPVQEMRLALWGRVYPRRKRRGVWHRLRRCSRVNPLPQVQRRPWEQCFACESRFAGDKALEG